MPRSVANVISADMLRGYRRLHPRQLVCDECSRADVLPWSTWPMTVTTGARGRRGASICAESSSMKASGVIEFGGKRLVPHFDDNHRGFLVDDLVDGHHRAHLHQRLDDFCGLDGHFVGQIGN